MNDFIYAKLLLLGATCKNCEKYSRNVNKYGIIRRPKCCLDLRKSQTKREKTKENFVCEKWHEM